MARRSFSSLLPPAAGLFGPRWLRRSIRLQLAQAQRLLGRGWGVAPPPATKAGKAAAEDMRREAHLPDQDGDAGPPVLTEEDGDVLLTPDPGTPEPADGTLARRVSPRASPRSFRGDSFQHEGRSWPFRLYVPSGVQAGEPLPMVVLLHGCTQTATDFALGTAMNELAEQRRFYVLYPEQRQDANHVRCWNWFEPVNQRRGSGESAMIAALTRHVMRRRAVDASRVYVAGLSAGGAMGAVLGALYPELFAAVGVHSGLPCGAAHDIPSAFTAMRSGPPDKAPPSDLAPLATIVFHGTADKTVHPGNGERIAIAAMRAAERGGISLARTETLEAAGGMRSARRLRWSAPDGTPWVEYWEVDAGTHGWSGGNAAGSHTDPAGPGASAAMLDFFLRHELPVQAHFPF